MKWKLVWDPLLFQCLNMSSSSSTSEYSLPSHCGCGASYGHQWAPTSQCCVPSPQSQSWLTDAEVLCVYVTRNGISWYTITHISSCQILFILIDLLLHDQRCTVPKENAKNTWMCTVQPIIVQYSWWIFQTQNQSSPTVYWVIKENIPYFILPVTPVIPKNTIDPQCKCHEK